MVQITADQIRRSGVFSMDFTQVHGSDVVGRNVKYLTTEIAPPNPTLAGTIRLLPVHAQARVPAHCCCPVSSPLPLTLSFLAVDQGECACAVHRCGWGPTKMNKTRRDAEDLRWPPLPRQVPESLLLQLLPAKKSARVHHSSGSLQSCVCKTSHQEVGCGFY